MARSVCRVIVPLTRGSTTTSRPVTTAIVRATDSISALLKFSVIGSPRRGATSCAKADGRQAAISNCAASATVPRREAGRRLGFMVNPV